MKKSDDTVSYTADELKQLRTEGKSLSDWKRANSMSEEDLESAIADDPEEAGLVLDWTRAIKGLPEPKSPVSIRLDPDVLAFFRAGGRGYQTRINRVLRTYMEQVRKRAG